MNNSQVEVEVEVVAGEGGGGVGGLRVCVCGGVLSGLSAEIRDD